LSNAVEGCDVGSYEALTGNHSGARCIEKSPAVERLQELYEPQWVYLFAEDPRCFLKQIIRRPNTVQELYDPGGRLAETDDLAKLEVSKFSIFTLSGEDDTGTERGNRLARFPVVGAQKSKKSPQKIALPDRGRI
jgi:hypothetical protein